MSLKVFSMTLAAAIVGAGAGVMVGQHVFAAAPAEYEKAEQIGGGGAPQKVLIDNEDVRVHLVAFPQGFDRTGGMKRRAPQLLVYIDPGDYTILRSGATGQVPKTKTPPKPLEAGTVVFHEKDSMVSWIHINTAYRILFLEFKK